MSKSRKQWALDPSEVSWGGSWGSSGRRKHATKSGRVNTVTNAELELYHEPTGICVKGEVPRGNYSRSEMQKLKQELLEELFPQLEKLVAQHLRIPGR